VFVLSNNLKNAEFNPRKKITATNKNPPTKKAPTTQLINQEQMAIATIKMKTMIATMIETKHLEYFIM
jgi:hypothetical protein